MTSIPKIGLSLAVAAILVIALAGGKLFEYMDADEVMVIQSLTGSLTFATEAGPYWQGFGRVVKCKKRDQFWFLANKTDKDVDESLRIRFNDNAHARISGSIAWEMPTDAEHLRVFFQKYGSCQALEDQLIKTSMERAVYMTGPLMSSKESAAERRNEVLQLIEDQVKNGIYLTRTIAEEVTDPITKEKKYVNVVKLVMDEKTNLPKRSADSPLDDFGIKTYNLAINEIKYDPAVEKQIEQQQQAIMQVQTAIARAKEAEQDALTVAERGKADAAKAKWEQEKENAMLVAKAEGLRRQAELNAQAAKFYKEEQLLKAEADAGYRQRIMQADNALEKRLEAQVKINEIWAKAVQGYQGNWVPVISSGGGTDGKAGSGMQTLIDMLSVKTAKELGLDMGIGTTKTGR
jgi:regulator of protease activity HflC (stomatin/prohibitin superfamily)